MAEQTLEQRCAKLLSDFETEKAEYAAGIQAEIDALDAKIERAKSELDRLTGRRAEEVAGSIESMEEEAWFLTKALRSSAEETYRNHLGKLEFDLRHEMQALENGEPTEEAREEYQRLVLQYEAVESEWRRVSAEEEAEVEAQEDVNAQYALCRDLGADI